MFLHIEQDVMWHGNHVQVLKIQKLNQNVKIRERIVLQSGWNGLIYVQFDILHFID